MSLVHKNAEKLEKALVVGIVLPDIAAEEVTDQLDEMELLAETAGAEVIGQITQNRQNIDPATFLGKGKIEEVINQAKELGCSLVIFNDEISPTHAKNIQKIAGEELKIIDRAGLILDIFHKHAKTREAKTQVELARLQYLLPRLTKMWTHLERQMGGIGTRGGPGEAQIEIDRRIVQKQISRLKSDLKKIENQTRTQSHNRKDELRVALVGYTNAGKSTIMKVITNENVFIENQLFATLDTTIRRVELEPGLKVLLSDTVGFIRKLPHDLVASFRSTLLEAADATLLLKVIDASSNQIDIHLRTIDNALKRLKLEEIPSLFVFNKIDLIDDPEHLTNLEIRFPDAVFISALKNLRMPVLQTQILNILKAQFTELTIDIPYSKTKILNTIYSTMTVVSREDLDDKITMTIKGRPADIEALKTKL